MIKYKFVNASFDVNVINNGNKSQLLDLCFHPRYPYFSNLNCATKVSPNFAGKIIISLMSKFELYRTKSTVRVIQKQVFICIQSKHFIEVELRAQPHNHGF